MPNAHAYDAIMKQVVVGLNVPPETDNHDASALVAFNVAQSTLSDVTALLASFLVVIELAVMIALVGVTRISVIVKLEAALELFGTVTLASTIYGLPAPIDD